MKWLLYLPLLLLVPMIVRAVKELATKPTQSEAAFGALPRQLREAQKARRGQKVCELSLTALTRARGGGSWSLEAVFDGPAAERVMLGSGAPCETELAEQLRVWTTATSKRLGATPRIEIGSDT